MPGPKPGALPLGDIPLERQQIDFSLKTRFFQFDLRGGHVSKNEC